MLINNYHEILGFKVGSLFVNALRKYMQYYYETSIVSTSIQVNFENSHRRRRSNNLIKTELALASVFTIFHK